MAQTLVGTTTTLIDKTSNENYIYIGSAAVYVNKAPQTNQQIWQIMRITLVDGQATKIENAHASSNEQQFFKWDDRTTLNYI